MSRREARIKHGSDKRKRPAHRPKAYERPIGPLEIESIREGFLRRRPVAWIADELNVNEATVRGHLRRTIIPELQDRGMELLNEELSRIDNLEKEAWEGFDRSRLPATKEKAVRHKSRRRSSSNEAGAKSLSASGEKTLQDHGVLVKKVYERIYRDGETAWLDLVRWCIAERNRMLGRYATDKRKSGAAADGPQRPVNVVVVESPKQIVKFERFKAYEHRVMKSQSDRRQP